MPSRNDNDTSRDKSLEDAKHFKTVTYKFCGKHGVRFPEGERCPSCQSEEKQREEKRR